MYIQSYCELRQNREKGVVMEVIFNHRLIFLCVVSCLLWNEATGSSYQVLENHPPKETPFVITNTQDYYNLLLNVHPNVTREDRNHFWKNLDRFVKKLHRKQMRYSSEERLVRHIFYKIHNRYLQHYQQYSTFYDLLDKGYYDCITGTALYALVLDALDIKFTIHELPYHVYMTVDARDSDQPLLLESTDGMTGFVNEPEAFSYRITAYHDNSADDNEESYHYSYEINGKINFKQLTALNYYNEAILHYNAQDLPTAQTFLEQARILYPSRRMETLHELIQQVARQQLASSDR